MKSKGKQLGGGCLLLFGLPFLCAGLVVTGIFFKELGDYRRAASWERVPARILSAELESHRGSKGGYTYSVKASYSYEFEGRTYHGSRVSPDTGSSSDSRHAERHAILKRHRETGQPFLAWVNPEAPSESMLFREMTPMSWMLLPFGLVFAMAGLFVSGLGVRGMLGAGARKRQLERDPGRPWRADPRWPVGFVFDARAGRGVAGAWGLSVFLTLFIGMFVYMVFREPSPLFARIIVAFFALVALTVIGGAIYVTLRFLKYGSPRLEMARMPVVPGGRLVCAVVCRRHVRVEGSFHVKLTCKHTVGSGKHSHVEELHQSSVEVDRDLAGNYEGTAIPIEVAIPAGLPPTGGDGDVDWELEVTASTPGVDFKAEFDLPVYVVEDESLIETRSPGGG